MSWTNGYVGIPYVPFGRGLEGCDCWGLVVLAYAAELGIVLPDYSDAYASPEEQAEVDALVGRASVEPVWSRIDDPQPLDVLVFRRGRLETHVGLHVDRGRMLHVTADDCAKLERYDVGAWSHRLTGVFRHAAHALQLERNGK